VARIGAGGNATYDFEITWNAFTPPPDLPHSRVIHTGSVAAFLEPGASSLREFLRSGHGTEICFDPNVRPALVGSRQEARRTFEETAQLSTVVKMSDEDARYLYADLPAENVLDEVLSYGPRLAIITLGGEGAILATPYFRVSVQSWPVNVVDTIGAGDTFMAAVIDALLDGTELDPQGLRYIGDNAAHLAGVTVSRAGADLPSSADRFYRRSTTHLD
jgi:fructokinase